MPVRWVLHQKIRENSGGHLNDTLDLKEPSQPPDLKDALANDDTNDKKIPPLDSTVGALSRVTVGALADNNIALLILYHLQHLEQLAHLRLKRVVRRVRLGYVNNAVHIERDFLGGGTPMLIAEAIYVFAVVSGLEGEIAVGC